MTGFGGDRRGRSSRRSRRRFLGTAGGLLSAAAGCLEVGRDGPDSIEFADGFEDGLTGWETGADVPADPNRPGQPVAWLIDRSTERAASGTASVRFFLDGRQDDGTIWIVRPISVVRGRSYEMSVRTAAWSASESFNTLAYLVMYVGPLRPASEGSFPAPGTNSTGAGVTPTGGLREVLNRTEGFQPYTFTWETAPLSTETIYLAAGVSAVWETEMTYFLDDLSLTATERSPA